MRLFKKVLIPSGEQSELLAYESWSVRWFGFRGNSEYFGLYHQTPESEVFTSKEDAETFANSLRDALKLLKYSGPIMEVKVIKNTQWQNSKTTT